jgi:hypothetical protein
MILLKQNIPIDSDIDIDFIVKEVLRSWEKSLKNLEKPIDNEDGIIELEIDEEE